MSVVFVVLTVNGIQPSMVFTLKLADISGSIHISLVKISVPQLLVTDKVAVYVPGDVYACVWSVIKFVLLSFITVPSPKSHLKLAAVPQFGLSPIIELFEKAICVFTQLVFGDSNLAIEGSKITILFIVDLIGEKCYHYIITVKLQFINYF